MAPSPSAATTQAPRPEAEVRASREPPRCPRCAEPSEGEVDAYGVHRCGGCGVEFRPPWRVPIRGAGVSPANEGGNGWIGLGVVGALIIGVAIAAGDSQAPSEPPPFDAFALDAKIEVPAFEPIVLDDLQLGLGQVVGLDYEVHVSSLEHDELFLTGQVRNGEAHPVSIVDVEVGCLGATGERLETHTATQACERMKPGEVCAWTLDVRVPGIAGFEIDARAQRELIEPMTGLDLRARFDGEGRRLGEAQDELALDPERRLVRFTIAPGVSVFDVRAAIVSYDADGRVRAVEVTRWPGMVVGATEHSRSVAMLVADDIHGYELRLTSSLALTDAPAPTEVK